VTRTVTTSEQSGKGLTTTTTTTTTKVIKNGFVSPDNFYKKNSSQNSFETSTLLSNRITKMNSPTDLNNVYNINNMTYYQPSPSPL